MALTPGTDTYATVAELDAHCLARGITLTAATNGAKEIILTKALDYLETLPFSGTAVDDDQELFFPINEEDENSGTPYDIIKAQIVCAIIYDGGGDPMATITQKAISKSVAGAVSVTYSEGSSANPIYPILNRLVAPYLLSGTGGGNFAITRA